MTDAWGRLHVEVLEDEIIINRCPGTVGGQTRWRT